MALKLFQLSVYFRYLIEFYRKLNFKKKCIYLLLFIDVLFLIPFNLGSNSKASINIDNGSNYVVVRAALYLAAHSLVTRSSEWSSLKVWGLKLSKTKGHRRAVIAVARKLAVILHKM